MPTPGGADPDRSGGRSTDEHEDGRGHEWFRAQGGQEEFGGATHAVDEVPAAGVAQLPACPRSPGAAEAAADEAAAVSRARVVSRPSKIGRASCRVRGLTCVVAEFFGG